VVDRLIQQALLQVLQPLVDPSFSEHSHGFRPGRSAQGAVLKARQHVQAGDTTVVDVDLEKFFDRVNRDILMDRLASEQARILHRRLQRVSVLQALRGWFAVLALKLNESKTAVAEVWGRKFLGCCLHGAPGRNETGSCRAGPGAAAPTPAGADAARQWLRQ